MPPGTLWWANDRSNTPTMLQGALTLAVLCVATLLQPGHTAPSPAQSPAGGDAPLSPVEPACAAVPGAPRFYLRERGPTEHDWKRSLEFAQHNG